MEIIFNFFPGLSSRRNRFRRERNLSFSRFRISLTIVTTVVLVLAKLFSMENKRSFRTKQKYFYNKMNVNCNVQNNFVSLIVKWIHSTNLKMQRQKKFSCCVYEQMLFKSFISFSFCVRPLLKDISFDSFACRAVRSKSVFHWKNHIFVNDKKKKILQKCKTNLALTKFCWQSNESIFFLFSSDEHRFSPFRNGFLFFAIDSLGARPNRTKLMILFIGSTIQKERTMNIDSSSIFRSQFAVSHGERL